MSVNHTQTGVKDVGRYTDQGWIGTLNMEKELHCEGKTSNNWRLLEV